MVPERTPSQASDHDEISVGQGARCTGEVPGSRYADTLVARYRVEGVIGQRHL